jgi:hypothetical protein
MLNKKQQAIYITNPQRWNRYVYVLNNPLRYVDPNGLAEIPVWDDLDKKLRDDLAKRGLNKQVWNDWNNDKRQQILNTRASLMAAGVWGNVTSIGFGSFQVNQEQAEMVEMRPGMELPTFNQAVSVTQDNKNGWAVIMTTNQDIRHALEAAGYKSESAIWNHPEGTWTYKERGDDVVAHIIGFKTGTNLMQHHFDTGGGSIFSVSHFKEWWYKIGGATQDQITRALGNTPSAQHLRGISPSVDKLLTQGQK